MYVPPQFAQTDPQALHRIMREHPLGTLVRTEHGVLDADHIPFELDPAAGPMGVLKAHVARANPLWQRCPTGTPVMVIFRGAQAYISPNWYPSKHETHRQVPTWNYEVVHAHGTLSIHDDERYVRALVARLTREHDAAEPRPWKMGEAPADYLQMMLGNIVGIEVTITSLVGKSKLSQNRELRDRRNAAETLATRGRDDLAQAMRATLPPQEG
jgi:transcriptional regulator